MNNIKSYKEFLNERRLSNTTLYSAADKFDDVGHDRLSKMALDKIQRDEEEISVDLIVSEYYDFSENDFPVNMYDFTRKIEKNGGKYYGKVNSDNFNSPMKHKFIEDARLILVDVDSGNIVMLFTNEEEDEIYVLSLDIFAEKDTINGVQFEMNKNAKNKLAERKDIPVLVKIVKQAYNNSSFQGTQTVRSKIHDKLGEPKSENLIDKIDGMFVKNKRTFYSDLNKDQLKSEKTIDKYSL